MFWETVLVLSVVMIIGLVCYSCYVASSNSHKDSVEEFEEYLKEKERVKNGRRNDV